MGSLSTRFPPFLTDCCVAAAICVVLVLLLPLFALAAFALRPLIMLVSLLGIFIALCCPVVTDARRRNPEDVLSRIGRPKS